VVRGWKCPVRFGFTYVVVATHLDTVADAANSAVGKGLALDLCAVTFVVAAVESLCVGAGLDVDVGRSGLVGLVGLGRSARSSKSTGGNGEESDDGELHFEELGELVSKKRVVKSRLRC
jgi:hypothetical protein